MHVPFSKVEVSAEMFNNCKYWPSSAMFVFGIKIKDEERKGLGREGLCRRGNEKHGDLQCWMNILSFFRCLTVFAAKYLGFFHSQWQQSLRILRLKQLEVM